MQSIFKKFDEFVLNEESAIQIAKRELISTKEYGKKDVDNYIGNALKDLLMKGSISKSQIENITKKLEKPNSYKTIVIALIKKCKSNGIDTDRLNMSLEMIIKDPKVFNITDEKVSDEKFEL